MNANGKNPSEHLLEKTAHLFSNGLTALEHFLSRVSAGLRAASIRARRFIWTQVLLGLRNVRYLLGLFSVFLALAWIGSGFHEFTFHNLRLLKRLGWAGTVVIGLIAFGGLIAMFYPLKEQSPKRAMTGNFVLLHLFVLTLLGVAIPLHYDFQSPVLHWTQLSMRLAFKKTASFLSRYYPSQSQAVSADTQQSPSTSEIPIPLPISVECKASNGINWVPADSNTLDLKPVTIPLNMWVERMWLKNGSTILDLAVKGWYPSGTVNLDEAKGAYIVDDVGKVYPLTDDSGDYSFFGGRHTLAADEVYRFQLSFPGLDHRSKTILLHHPQFQQHILNLCPNW
jgi:hypothetical protein